MVVLLMSIYRIWFPTLGNHGDVHNLAAAGVHLDRAILREVALGGEFQGVDPVGQEGVVAPPACAAAVGFTVLERDAYIGKRGGDRLAGEDVPDVSAQ